MPIHSTRDFDFKENKRYIVGVSVKFEGEFVKYEEENGEVYAIFKEKGRTDRGKIPYRKVKINNIMEYGLIKVRS